MSEDVPGYRVLEQVGEGGFSVVYRAHQEHLDRMVALKVLSIGSVDDAAMRRFQRESKITGRLSGHPNIVTVLDTGTTRSGRPYIAMEYFEHGALTDRLAREGPLPVADVLRIGVKMAGALAATHETDVLHRDVKPQNVLLSRYGEPALADFGIARLVDSFDATHTQAFTPHHAAPEVLEGRSPGVGADIYSLGSTLYQLLAGRPAFKGPPGEGIALLMLRILNDAPPPIPRPDVPRPVADVIGRAMAKTPEQRFATAVEFARALQRVQGEMGLPVTDVAYGGEAVPPVSRTDGAETGPSSPSRPLSGPPAAPRLSFPDASGPPLVPEWAPTAQEPSALSATPAPVPPTVPASAPPSPWHPDATPSHTPNTTPNTAPHATPNTTPHATPNTTPHAYPQQLTQDRPDDGPRRGLIVAAGVALVGGLALGIGALVLTRGGDGGTGPTTGTPSQSAPSTTGNTGAPVEPISPAQLAATRPRKLIARPVGRTAALLWTLPPGAKGLPLLIQQQPAGTAPIVPVKHDSRSATVPGLRPRTAYCFRVGAVLRLNEGKAPDVSWSAPACLNKAKKRPS